MRNSRLLSIAASLALLAGVCTGAAAAELKVLCDDTLRPAMQELAPAFEKSSGQKLSIQYDTADKIEQKVAADDPIDVAILPKPQVDKLIRVAKLVGGSSATLASTKSPELVYMAASPFFSEQPLPAKALIDFLAAPANKAVYKAKGMEPG